MIRLKLSLLGLVILISQNLFSQENIGIGTSTPDAKAVLDIRATDKGVLIPRLTAVQRNAMSSGLSATQNGLLVFDSDSNKFYYWNVTEWTQIGGAAGSVVAPECYTLQEAYDCTTPGAGRTLNVNSGSLEINLSSIASTTEALMASSTAGTESTPSSALSGYNSSFGVAVYGGNNKTDNPYNAIHGMTSSGIENTSGVAGYYEGTAQGVGVYGSVFQDVSGGGKAGVFGYNNRSDGGYGMLGQGFNGVVGQTNFGTGFGVYGGNTNAIGTDNGVGVCGDGDYGVWGQTQYGYDGVFGINARTDGGIGVEGQGFNGTVGITVQGAGYGIYGENSSTGTTDNNIGVAGIGWVGVYGVSNDGTGYGVFSDSDFGCSGTKSFVIDHPQDPQNKFLKHFCMESPEVLNVYRGTITLDASGEATVNLPEYFSSVNINFTYQLTPVGAACPGLYISREVEGNSFAVAGGAPGTKISWVVYAERNDPYLQQNPQSKQVVVEKRQEAKGKYLMPQLYGQTADKKMVIPLKKDNEIMKKRLVVPVNEKATQQNQKIRK
ncbi:MAG: hypothetical protein A2W91_08475 [Bacteroidetes bacterium GWF2_38_335]|nr:MAG: hypothetical protein A2W91_08475 [Bacteroidetes bacterium GWF2_38_335]OFY78924.1 MAG: hypothetical protein A2281_02245 [Bacteroidetes bacterium RIFOXYA12_FULL_38_20]HBS85987.1 hypothetical protein [Bacteroidales bacterium]